MALFPSVCVSRLSATRIGCALALMTISGASGSIDSDRVYAAELRNQAFEDSAWSPDQVRRDNSSLRISALVQARYMASNIRKSSSSPSTFRANTTGFTLPRTQLSFDGTIVNSQLTYKITMDFGDAELGLGRGTAPTRAQPSGTGHLLDAYAQYNFAEKREGYYLKAGQFRHILHAEEAIDTQYQLAVERSLVNEFFSHGYTQGIALGRVDRDWAWEISINDGGRFLSSAEVANTSFASPFEADIAVTGRVDRKLKGSWEQFVDFTSFQGSQSALKIGGGMMWQLQGDTNPGGFIPPLLSPRSIRAEVISWTIDVQYEGDGWNLFAAYMGNTIDWKFDTGLSLFLANHGLVAQGGYFLDQQNELFARGEAIWYDDTIARGFGVMQGEPVVYASVGWNYYIVPESHAAKFTVDFTTTTDDTFAFNAGVTSSDTLPDGSTTGLIGGTTAEYLFRAQLQFLF